MNIKKFCYGNHGPLILWGTYNFRENETEQTMETIRQQLPDAEYTVVAVEVDDWFRQFSPWPSKQLEHIVSCFGYRDIPKIHAVG